MDPRLGELTVLVLDCQASGATPAHGDLLELGWAACEPSFARGRDRPLQVAAVPTSHWVRPRTERRVSAPVRELTGWSEACLAEALSEQEVFHLFDAQVREVGRLLAGVPDQVLVAGGPARFGSDQESCRTPVVIHFARFELPFLRDLYERHAPDTAFPLEVV